MGKHGSHTRVPRDFYPTPPWVTAALAEHIELAAITNEFLVSLRTRLPRRKRPTPGTAPTPSSRSLKEKVQCWTKLHIPHR
jgi:hypothetical protein